MGEVGFIKKIKGWQIAVALVALAAIGLLISRMFGQKGFLRNAFDRSADGIGWLMDRGADGMTWLGGGAESGITGAKKWWNETDFTDFDWTFWD